MERGDGEWEVMERKGGDGEREVMEREVMEREVMEREVMEREVMEREGGDGER